MTAQPIGTLAFSPDAAPAAPFEGGRTDSSGRAVLAVRQIRLTDFRNYRQLRLDCGLEPVVLVGANGTGKTNLLEALSFLAPGRGLAYILLCAQNRPESVKERVRGWGPGWHVDTAGSSNKTAGWERLQVIRICRAD